MAEQTFGGDDDRGNGANGANQPPMKKKKIDLDKYGLRPDTNIRDVFWDVMASYAATKKPGAELKELAHDRFTLMRIALSVLTTSTSEQYGLTPRFAAKYTLMLLLDGGWHDAIIEFFDQSLRGRQGIVDNVAHAVDALSSQEEYRAKLAEVFVSMMRGHNSNGVALTYLAYIARIAAHYGGPKGAQTAEFIAGMKKELMIFARGDIGQNQLNAIKIIGQLQNDPDAKKTLLILLSHWDREARLAAADALASMAVDDEIKSTASKRLTLETDPTIKNILERLTK